MKATCHCGAVELNITLAISLTDINQDNCSICSKRGAAMVTALVKVLKIVRGENNLTQYYWASKIAKHYFCRKYGIYTRHQKRLNSGEMGVNFATIEGLQLHDFGHIQWLEAINHLSDTRF